MKKIAVNCGFKLMNDNGEVVGYEGDYTNEGRCYVDLDAFYNKQGICFICESDLEEMEDVQSIDFTTINELIEFGGVDTYDSIVENALSLAKNNRKLAENLAETFLLESAENGWCCSSTWFGEIEIDEFVENVRKEYAEYL